MPLIESQPDQLATVYARSLFELAESAGGRDTAESTLGELQDILELARADARFGEFLSSLVVPVIKRDASLKAIFDGKASDLTVRFLRLLNRKGRLSHLPAITAAFDGIVQDAFGRVEVDVFTAAALDDSEKQTIKDKVGKKLGKDIVLHCYVEPAMLGGVKLKIGDQLIDDSLATQLRRVRDKLVTQGGPRIRSAAGKIIDAG
jgi:F-type H+-transporting ATPase subunit delta